MITTISDIHIALAGPLAEAKALGKPLQSLGAKSDLESCIYQVARLKTLGSFVARYTDFEPVIAEDILSLERTKMRHWVAHPKAWSAIVYIAERLSVKGLLEGKEIGDLIGKSNLYQTQTTLNFSN